MGARLWQAMTQDYDARQAMTQDYDARLWCKTGSLVVSAYNPLDFYDEA